MAIIGTLPNNIQNGQQVDATPVMADFNFIVNQVNANATPLGTISSGALLNVRVITSTQVYTPTVGTNSVIVDLQGAGGAGGGAQVTGAGQYSLGLGGGAGGRTISRLTSAFSGVTVTIGLGGAGSTGSGGSGGVSTFGAILTANGGQGGQVLGANSTGFQLAGGAGGSASGGNLLNVTGQAAPSLLTFAPATSGSLSGSGASSIYGAGGVATSGTSIGFNGSGFGSGASGASNIANAGAGQNGGNGAGGICFIYEFA